MKKYVPSEKVRFAERNSYDNIDYYGFVSRAARSARDKFMRRARRIAKQIFNREQQEERDNS